MQLVCQATRKLSPTPCATVAEAYCTKAVAVFKWITRKYWLFGSLCNLSVFYARPPKCFLEELCLFLLEIPPRTLGKTTQCWLRYAGMAEREGWCWSTHRWGLMHSGEANMKFEKHRWDLSENPPTRLNNSWYQVQSTKSICSYFNLFSIWAFRFILESLFKIQEFRLVGSLRI